MEDQELALDGILGAITEIRQKQLQTTEQILKELNVISNRPIHSAEDSKALADIFQSICSEIEGMNKQIRKIGELVNLAHMDSEGDIISELTEIKGLLIQKVEAQPILKTRFDKFRHWLKSYSGIDLSPACLFIFLETALIAILMAVNSNILSEKMTYRDNDLKYRYILMKGKATGEKLEHLEQIFYRQDNRRIVKQIRDSVCDFEYRCQKQAKAIERSRLLQEQAEQLKQEAERIKTR